MAYNPYSPGQRAALLDIKAGMGDSQTSIMDNLAPVGNTIRPWQLDRKVASLSDDMTPEEARHIPQAGIDVSKYGDIIESIIVLPAATSVLVVQRPAFTRSFLAVSAAAGILRVGFGRQAGPNSMPIPAGSVLWMDSVVAQNDVYLYSVAGTTATIWYINQDIASIRK
jgi:hypothetical protein